jgi:DNA-binding CsgD family transcriptional regulator
MVSVSDLNEMAAIATDAKDQVTYEREILRCIEHMVGFDVAFFKREGGPGPVVCGLERAWVEARERLFLDCGHEVAAVLEVAVKSGGVAVDLDTFGRRELERKQYYQKLMREVGGKSSALLPVFARGRCLSTLMLGLTGRAHRRREVEAMAQFAPTLRLCEEFRQARLEAAHARRANQGPELVSGSPPHGSSSRHVASRSPDGPRLPKQVPLSAAERDVLSYLALGYTNADIARARGNAPRTVRNQLSRAYAKLGVASRAEAVARLHAMDQDGA